MDVHGSHLGFLGCIASFCYFKEDGRFPFEGKNFDSKSKWGLRQEHNQPPSLPSILDKKICKIKRVVKKTE